MSLQSSSFSGRYLHPTGCSRSLWKTMAAVTLVVGAVVILVVGRYNVDFNVPHVFGESTQSMERRLADETDHSIHHNLRQSLSEHKDEKRDYRLDDYNEGGSVQEWLDSARLVHSADYAKETAPTEEGTMKDDQTVDATNNDYGGRFGRDIADVRFNKCPPISEDSYGNSTDYLEGVHQFVFPLMPSDYPVHGEKEALLRQETKADSVITQDDYQVYGADPDYWMSLVKPPYYPSCKCTDPFWEELRHVIRVQLARRNGDDPLTLSRWPDSWSHMDLEDIAQAVNGEYPASLQQTLIMQAFSQGVEMDTSILRQFRSVVDFIGAEVRIAALNTWSFEVVGPINFMLKWHAGVPRPEEMAWLIARGEYGVQDGVPSDIVEALQSMNLTNAWEFTAYSKGSPKHPSWPAMHASGSSCSVWLPAVAKITPEQYCEALRVDYAVAYARTVAGVHYPMDNIAGLNLGLKILQERLPAHLAEFFGYDQDLVQAKMDTLAFDWETFDPYNCTIDGVPLADRMV